MSTEPEAPDDLPAYVVEAVERQSSDRLDAIAQYARELAEFKRAQAEAEEIVEVENAEEKIDDAIGEEEFDAIDDLRRALPAGVSTHVKQIPTSEKKSKGYVYANYRENGEHRTMYLGPASKYGAE